MGIYGEYYRNVDERNRITIPSKLRWYFGSSFFLFFTMGNQIEMYSSKAFEKLSSKISSLNEFDPSAIKFQRAFFARVHEVEVDKAGRFLVPKKLLDNSGIEKEVVIVGMNNKAILWSNFAYEKFNSEMSDEDFTSLMSLVGSEKK